MTHFYPHKLVQHAALTIAVIFMGFNSFSQTSAPELVFKNSTVLSGTAGNDGAIYKFANVTTGVDAQVKINGRSSTNVILNDIDINTTGYDNAFQPLVNYINGGSLSANTVTDWYMEFQVSFFKSGTTTPVAVSSFNATGLDNDGNTDLHEYLSFYGLNNYTLENPTDITVSNITSGSTIVGKRFDGATVEFSGIDVTATQVMVTTSYVSTSSFALRVGGKAKGPISILNDGRQYSLWFKGFTYSNPVITTLPIDLVSFNAQLSGSSMVMLDWATSAETNASHFVVQRSVDGSNFTDQAIVFTEEGNSNTDRQYSYADNISSVNSSLVYYRLKMVDKDDKYKYSAVVIVRIGTEEQVALLAYPNPAVNQVSVTIPNDWQNKTIAYSIYNLNGILVKQKVSSNAGQTETFNIADQPAGLYIIKVANGNNTAVKQIIKVK